MYCIGLVTSSFVIGRIVPVLDSPDWKRIKGDELVKLSTMSLSCRQLMRGGEIVHIVHIVLRCRGHLVAPALWYSSIPVSVSLHTLSRHKVLRGDDVKTCRLSVSRCWRCAANASCRLGQQHWPMTSNQHCTLWPCGWLQASRPLGTLRECSVRE